MITIQMIVAVPAGIIFGIFIGFLIRKKVIERQFESIKSYSKKIINEAHRKAKTVKKEAMLRAKDTIYQMKLDFSLPICFYRGADACLSGNYTPAKAHRRRDINFDR